MFKASTTSAGPVQGVINALALAAEDVGESLAEYLSRADAFIYGTTHAINAVITGRTARTASLMTEGDGIVSRSSLAPARGRRLYRRDFDVERLWRDNRLNPIHEGTTGIQAVDLLGRKLLHSNGTTLRLLKEKVNGAASKAASIEALAEQAGALRGHFDAIEATLTRLGRAERAAAFDNATWARRAVGHGVIAWLRPDMAVLATDWPASDFPLGKVKVCQFFSKTSGHNVRCGCLSSIAGFQVMGRSPQKNSDRQLGHRNRRRRT